MMKTKVNVLTDAAMEGILTNVLRASKSASERKGWLRMREATLETLKEFGSEDEAQTGASGDFWITDEWQSSNYIPVVVNSFRMFDQRCVRAIQDMIRSENQSFSCSLVVPFPAKFWGLQVLITSDMIYSSARATSLREVEDILKEAGLSHLTKGES